MLQNEYLLQWKIGFNEIEHEPSKIWWLQNTANICHVFPIWNLYAHLFDPRSIMVENIHPYVLVIAFPNTQSYPVIFWNLFSSILNAAHVSWETWAQMLAENRKSEIVIDTRHTLNQTLQRLSNATKNVVKCLTPASRTKHGWPEQRVVRHVRVVDTLVPIRMQCTVGG